MRLCRVLISLPTLVHFLTTGRIVWFHENLPKDVQLRTVAYDAALGGFWLVVESEAFAEVREGDIIPERSLRITVARNVEEFQQMLVELT